jgi:hypothetical protein
MMETNRANGSSYQRLITVSAQARISYNYYDIEVYRIVQGGDLFSVSIFEWFHKKQGGSKNSIQDGHLLSFDFNNVHKIKLTHHQGRNQRFNLRWAHLISNKIKNKLIK